MTKAMSVRRKNEPIADKHVAVLRQELSDLKSQTHVLDATPVTSSNLASNEFDALAPVEQSAASLGVDPNSLKPIAFMNNAHYKQLLDANMLDDTLARRIEVSTCQC